MNAYLWEFQSNFAEFCSDGIHLTAEGSKIVVKEILKVLKEADWEPSLHWRSIPNEFSEFSPIVYIGPNNTPTNTSQIILSWQTQWD